MFDGLWFRSRAADRQRSDSAKADAGHHQAFAASFDEFSAPEGGFGRLDVLLGEYRQQAIPAAPSAPAADAGQRGEFALRSPGTSAG